MVRPGMNIKSGRTLNIIAQRMRISTMLTDLKPDVKNLSDRLTTLRGYL